MAMTKRKFYRQVFTVEVLSEEPIGPDIDLADLAYEIREGDCSGRVNLTKVDLLNGKQVAKALLKQASDPEFFQVNDKGEDVE
jgi:hypothetical protein